MLLRFRPNVIALRPGAVVILAGTNDIAGNTGPMTDEQIQGNLASMAELARASGIRVILSSILPVSESHVRPGDTAPPQTTRRPMARIAALNAWMKEYAATNGHVYLDTRRPCRTRRDCCAPSSARTISIRTRQATPSWRRWPRRRFRRR